MLHVGARRQASDGHASVNQRDARAVDGASAIERTPFDRTRASERDRERAGRRLRWIVLRRVDKLARVSMNTTRKRIFIRTDAVVLLVGLAVITCACSKSND